MRLRRAAAAAVAVTGLLAAGCASVVDGSGSLGAPIAPGPTQFPSQPAGTPQPSTTPTQSGGSTTVAPPTPCPHVSYAAAHLSFDCFSASFQQEVGSPVWPLSEYKTVEKSTSWRVEEGAGRWGPRAGQSLAAIAANVRQQMVASGGYLPAPKVATVRNQNTTVDGARAHLLQSTITLNPAQARKQHTKVKREKLWIVAVQVGTDDVSLWYATVPDLVAHLWAKVPALIKSIKVS